jgi:hypothetical protein
MHVMTSAVPGTPTYQEVDRALAALDRLRAELEHGIASRLWCAPRSAPQIAALVSVSPSRDTVMETVSATGPPGPRSGR